VERIRQSMALSQALCGRTTACAGTPRPPQRRGGPDPSPCPALTGQYGQRFPRSFGPFRPALPSAAGGGYTRRLECGSDRCVTMARNRKRWGQQWGQHEKHAFGG
jgi:hypothetical protein